MKVTGSLNDTCVGMCSETIMRLEGCTHVSVEVGRALTCAAYSVRVCACAMYVDMIMYV